MKPYALSPQSPGPAPGTPPASQEDPGPSAAFEIVALAASAGGLAALSQVLSGLPLEFSPAVVVVQHLDPRHRSLMADILNRRTPLPTKEAQDGEPVTGGTVFIAPPNRHLLVNPDATLSLSQSELVHFVRPSADLLFESVAASYRDRAIAVVLTGSGSDGAMGLRAVKKMGGTVIVQDEKTAQSSGCLRRPSRPETSTSCSHWRRSLRPSSNWSVGCRFDDRSGERPAVRGPARTHPDGSRFRLHGLQTLDAGAPDGTPDARSGHR